MQNRLSKYFAFFLALVQLSCTDPTVSNQQPDPVFPKSKDYSVRAAETVSFPITPNLDWELSMPVSESDWIHIDDNGVKAYKLRGQAGNHTVRFVAENIDDNYDIRVCPVTMKMGGKEAVIAVINLIPEYRSMAIYTAKTDEEGNYILIGSGEYEYNDSQSPKLELSWPRGLSSFTLPVKIVASFDWSITADGPKWLDINQTSSVESTTYVLMRGNPAYYPLEDEQGEIFFMDTKTNSIAFEIPVKIPGCKDIAFVDIDSDYIELNLKGEYNQQGIWKQEGCSFYFTSTPDSQIIPVSVEDGKYLYDSESWVDLSFTFPHGDASSYVVQDRLFHLKADVNYGIDREAVLLAVPGHIAREIKPSDMIMSDGSGIKEQYKDYLFATVHQMGVDPSEGWGVISPVNSKYTMAVKGAGIARAVGDDPALALYSEMYGTDEVYNLYYNNWYSYEDALLLSSVPFNSVSYYAWGYEDSYSDCIDMVYPDSNDHQTFSLSVSYFDEGYDCGVILRNDDEIVCVINCVLTETFWPVVDYRDIHFCAYDNLNGEDDPDNSILPHDVKLEELTEGSLYEQFKEYGIPVWRLVYYTTESSRNAMLYVPPFPLGNNDAIEIHPSESWIKVECALDEKVKPYIHVSMTDQQREDGNVGYLVLNGGGRPLFVLECERFF